MASFCCVFPGRLHFRLLQRATFEKLKSHFQKELYVASKSCRTWKILHKNKIRLTFWFLLKIVFDTFGDILPANEKFQHSLTSMYFIVLVMVMAYPNQLFGMTYLNGQTVNPTITVLPPPYATNETAIGQYQPVWSNREKWTYLRHWLKLLLVIHWQKH